MGNHDEEPLGAHGMNQFAKRAQEKTTTGINSPELVISFSPSVLTGNESI